jgi:copper chaperone CopZ
MQTSVFEAPALFGDHHVTEVRRILFNLKGVEDVYASSAFRAIQVAFDEKQTSHDQIRQALSESGYLDDLALMGETGQAAQRSEADGFFRQSAVYETMKKTHTFQQKVPYSGRPLWNCPGMGVVKGMEE